MTYTPGLMQYSPSHAFSQVCAATLGAGEPRPPREGRGGRPEAGGGKGEGDEGAGADAVRGEWRVDGIYGSGLVKEEQSPVTCEIVVVRDENESGRQTRDPNETG